MAHLTKFGKEVRKLRVVDDISLKTMADTLEVSSAYLSAVECGKKRIPDDLVVYIAMFFKLDKAKTKALQRAAADSQPNYKIDVSRQNDQARQTASMFARSVSTLSDTDISKIQSILRKHGE